MNSTATTVEASNARGTQHAERFFVHRLRLVAGAGAVVWLSTLVFLDDVIVALLALAPLVLVPLALSAAVQPDRNGRYPRSLGAISMLLLPAAVSLVIALSLRPGAVTGWLSIPWAATTVLIALMGLRRLVERGLRWIDETALDLGCLFIAVGGAWVVIATSGYRPMGFSLREILLAAVHFHYAGFLLPVIGTMACRAGAGRTCRFALSGLLVGVPSVALGIAYSPLLEVVGAVLTALSAASIAAVQAWGASRWRSRRLQRTLLVGSSAARSTAW
jgi:YndJ-like protein